MKKCKKTGQKRRTLQKGGWIYATDIPIDPVYHGDMTKPLLKKHVSEVQQKLDRLNDDINHARSKEHQEQAGLDNYKSMYETTRIKNDVKYSEINTKWYMYLLSGLFAIIMTILHGIGSALYLLIFVVIGNLLLLIFAVIKLVFMNYVFLGFLLFVLSIILILQFVFGYVIPLPGFVSKPTANPSIAKNEQLASTRMDYQTDFFGYMHEFFTNFPNIFVNMAVNMKLLYEKLAKFFGENDVNVLYIVDREHTTAGRWDNLYNMQLGLVSQNIENIPAGDANIYSIIKPAPLKMQMTDIQDLDINKLPPSMQDGIKKDKEAVQFNWEVYPNTENVSKYRISCDTYNKKNEKFNLFSESINNECTPIKQTLASEYVEGDNSPKYYDTPTKIGDKSFMIDLFIE